MSDLKRKAEAKTESTLRTPKPKKKLGLSVPAPLKMPHEELIVNPNTSVKTTIPSQTSHSSQTSLTRHTNINPLPEQEAKINNENRSIIEQLANSQPQTMPSQTSLTRHTQKGFGIPESTEQLQSVPSQTSHTQGNPSPIAPVKDFSRVANSITRDAVPEGLFRGKSKLLYDYLYSQTRGAIVPTYTIRISRPKLMTAAGIGSRVTFDANIEHLIQVGLVEVRSIVGEHNGNEYRVYLPEERSFSTESMPSQTSLTSMTGYAQKVDRLVRLESRQTRHTLNPDLSSNYDVPNTCIIHDDDDLHTHMEKFYRPLIEAVTELTGVGVKLTDKEIALWQECGEILAEELRDAAGNTKTISSIPAFFAEHLRRQFKKKLKSTKLPPPAPDPQGTQLVPSTSKPFSINNPPVENPEAQSKFTLEQCKQYADYLQSTGQGIINPGGYATVIFRSGEADELINNFLETESHKSEEQRFLEKIETLRQLHSEDSSYQPTDLKEDLKYRCKRDGIAWNEELVNRLLNIG